MEYCTLAYYVRPECALAPWKGSKTLLLATLHDNYDMQILVHPDWRSLVQKQDLDYLNELFESFIERASDDPLVVFKQLASLSVGPIVTKCAGTKAYSELLGDPQYGHFVELC